MLFMLLGRCKRFISWVSMNFNKYNRLEGVVFCPFPSESWAILKHSSLIFTKFLHPSANYSDELSKWEQRWIAWLKETLGQSITLSIIMRKALYCLEVILCKCFPFALVWYKHSRVSSPVFYWKLGRFVVFLILSELLPECLRQIFYCDMIFSDFEINVF